MAIDFIRGERFKALADNELIYYCNTHDIEDFFKTPPQNNFVLISHNSDGNITNNPIRFNNGSSNDVNFNNIIIPRNLIKWYGQNINVNHEKIESIPIGLENSEWFKDIRKESKILQIIKTKKIYKNTLYICHNINTNPKERLEPYEIFNNKNWVTIEYGVNGLNFENYLNNIYNHKFVLCPEGNGIDTHRTWETLYSGSIPIEKRNLNNRFYEDLPICFVNEWSEINEDFLNSEFIRISNTDWNLDKLNFNYWIEKIKKI